jgi:hypothetical protein
MKLVPYGQPQELGKMELPETTVSYPYGGHCRQKYTGIVTATVMRMPILEKGIVTMPKVCPVEERERILLPYRSEYPPEFFKRELAQVCIAHNQRTGKGHRMQVFRLFGGPVGTTDVADTFDWMANGAAAAAATPTVDGGAGTLTVTDLSMGTITDNVTTNEFVVGTASGLQRAQGATATLGTAPASFDATSTNEITLSYSPTTTSRVYNAALFDSTVGGTANMYAEAALTPSSASVVSGDTLIVTWTATM